MQRNRNIQTVQLQNKVTIFTKACKKGKVRWTASSEFGTYGLCEQCHSKMHSWLSLSSLIPILTVQYKLQMQIYRKIPKNSDTRKICCNHAKIWKMWLYNCEMCPKDVDGIANSADPDQTTPLGAVWSGSTLFAQTYLSENLGKIRYLWYYCVMIIRVFICTTVYSDQHWEGYQARYHSNNNSFNSLQPF